MALHKQLNARSHAHLVKVPHTVAWANTTQLQADTRFQDDAPHVNHIWTLMHPGRGLLHHQGHIQFYLCHVVCRFLNIRGLQAAHFVLKTEHSRCRSSKHAPATSLIA